METLTNINELIKTTNEQLQKEGGIRITVLSLEDILYLVGGALIVGILLIIINKKLIK